MKIRSTPSQYKVELFSYDSNWAELYLAESEKISSIFGDNLSSIHHIGSTSIPTIKAKPIVDILVFVKQLELSDGMLSELENGGYTERLFNDGRIRRTFNKDINEVRLYNVHIFEQGYEFGQEMLRFCEILRKDSVLAKEYESLKIACLSKSNNPQTYYESKLHFFDTVLEK